VSYGRCVRLSLVSDEWQLLCYNQPAFIHSLPSCGSGGTGRHTILRGWRRKAWGFKSPLPHQKIAMNILITLVHILVCFFLIGVVLLQSGKSGDIAAAFGGQGSQTAFGPRGAATALTKATTWSAIIFIVTSITLSILTSRGGHAKSVLDSTKSAPTQSQPVK